jgi:hypothetical protein
MDPEGLPIQQAYIPTPPLAQMPTGMKSVLNIVVLSSVYPVSCSLIKPHLDLLENLMGEN